MADSEPNYEAIHGALLALSSCVDEVALEVKGLAVAVDQLDPDSMKEELSEKLRAHRDAVASAAIEIAAEARTWSDEAQEVLDDASAMIVEKSDLIDEMAAELEQGFATTEGAIGELKGGIESAVEGAGAVADEILKSVDRSVQTVAEAMDRLGRESWNVALHLESRAESGILEPLRLRADEFVAKIQSQIEEVPSHLLAEKLRSLRDVWVTEIRDLLRNLMEQFRQQLEAFRDRVTEGTASAGGDRMATGAIRDQLEAIIDPAMRELERFCGLAESVGISLR